MDAAEKFTNTPQNADSVLFRCSSLGYIMTEPREKSPREQYNECLEKIGKKKSQYDALKNKETKTAAELWDSIFSLEKQSGELKETAQKPFLSETCKTHLIDKCVSAKYGRQNDITNKYIEKGLAVEEDSITLYSRVKKEFFKKNAIRLKNEFIEGLPDLFKGKNVYKAERVLDIKSNWDIFTFFRTLKGDVNKMYYWQLQGYMALTGAKISTLAYCLVNTPPPLIFDELNRLKYRMGVIDPDTNILYQEACAEMEKSMTYDDIPMEERVNEIIIERNDTDIERAYERVKECRKWMNENLFKINKNN